MKKYGKATLKLDPATDQRNDWIWNGYTTWVECQDGTTLCISKDHTGATSVEAFRGNVIDAGSVASFRVPTLQADRKAKPRPPYTFALSGPRIISNVFTGRTMRAGMLRSSGGLSTDLVVTDSRGNFVARYVKVETEPDWKRVRR